MPLARGPTYSADAVAKAALVEGKEKLVSCCQQDLPRLPVESDLVGLCEGVLDTHSASQVRSTIAAGARFLESLDWTFTEQNFRFKMSRQWHVGPDAIVGNHGVW